MSCPNCACHECVSTRISPFRREPQVVKTGAGDPECAYERLAREYAAKGEVMPATWLLYCGCRKCSPTSL